MLSSQVSKNRGGFVWGGKIRESFLKEVALGALLIHSLQTWNGKYDKVSELMELMVDGEDDWIDKSLLYVVIRVLHVSWDVI